MEATMKPFSLKIKTLEIPIENKDGEAKKWTLKELSGKERHIIEGHVSNHLQYGSDGVTVTGVKGPGKLNSLLLSLCLYDENNKKFTMEEIDAWPASVRDALAEKANTLNALNEQGQQAVKATLVDKEGNG